MAYKIDHGLQPVNIPGYNLGRSLDTWVPLESSLDIY
jgi:hypothetical protein